MTIIPCRQTSTRTSPAPPLPRLHLSPFSSLIRSAATRVKLVAGLPAYKHRRLGFVTLLSAASSAVQARSPAQRSDSHLL